MTKADPDKFDAKGHNRFYARHLPDGKVYAISAEGDDVVGVSGPLLYSEVKDIDGLDYDPEKAEWAQHELALGHFAMVGHNETT